MLVKRLLWSTPASLGLLMFSVSQSTFTLAAPMMSASQSNKVKIPSFNVTVTLTEKARTRLEGKETIIVLASVYGEPKQNATVKLNEMGLVDLTGGQITLPRSGQAKFKALSAPASKVAQLSNQDYKINVNVFSGRRSSQDNLLSCDFFDSRISKIQPGVTLKCGLIGEYSGQAKNTADSSSQLIPAHGSFTHK